MTIRDKLNFGSTEEAEKCANEMRKGDMKHRLLGWLGILGCGTLAVLGARHLELAGKHTMAYYGIKGIEEKMREYGDLEIKEED